MEQRKLGDGPLVGALGFGCMGMSEFYGATDDEQSLATLEHAFEAGVTLFDTADIYGFGHNESLLGRFIRGKRDRVVIATKAGIVRSQADPALRGVDNSPAYLARHCEASLRRLGTDHVDLYYLHRIDPATPLEESIGALGRLVRDGRIGGIGLSNVTPDTVRAAHAIHPIRAVQNEFSLFTRTDQDTLLPTLARLGIAYVPYSPLGRGMLTGSIQPQTLAADDFRRNLPRFADEALAANGRLVAALQAIAGRRGVTPAQVALAWVLGQGPHVIPIPGTKRIRYLDENLAAAALALSDEEVAELQRIFAADAIAGLPYPNMSFMR
jgi:aryl-alcohol dehydrogenase-like predicted oxidoreductase